MQSSERRPVTRAKRFSLGSKVCNRLTTWAVRVVEPQHELLIEQLQAISVALPGLISLG